MVIFNKVKEYIEDNEFHIDIFENRIHVSNYQRIVSLGNEKIIIAAPHQKIYLHGQKFSLNKMLDDEILIEGILTKMEIINE